MPSGYSRGDFQKSPPFPPEDWPTWRMSLLKEIARGRAVQSRGKRNPRGVKRKMSGFRIRKRSEALNQPIIFEIVIK